MRLPDAFLAQMEPTDGFILAYPRSGSRWLMRVLSDMAHIADGREIAEYEQMHLQRPPVGTPGYAQHMRETSIFTDAHAQAQSQSQIQGREMPPPGRLGRSRLFRSHHVAEVILRCTGPIVYLVREAVPALSSYYHFAKQQKTVAEDTTLDAFCESHLPLWKDHVSTVLSLWAVHPERVCFTTYGDSAPFTQVQVQACATHFGIPADAETNRWALGRLADQLATLTALPTSLHQRGSNQGLKRDFPPALRAWIESETQDLFEQARGAEEARLMA